MAGSTRQTGDNQKVKFGTTVQTRTNELIADFRSSWPSLYRTPGAVVDEMAAVLLNVPPTVAGEVMGFCDKMLAVQEKKVDALKETGAGDLVLSDYQADIASYRRLRQHFSRMVPAGAERPNDAAMKRIDIAGESYVVFPDDWVVLNGAVAEACEHVLAVEVKNGDRYSAPHFVYFSDVPARQFDDDIAIKAIERVWPQVADVRKDMVEPVYDRNGVMLNMKEVSEAPYIGVFEIRDSTSFDAWEKPAYGAMVFRSKDGR